MDRWTKREKEEQRQEETEKDREGLSRSLTSQ